jgi:hypothetical protein
MKGAVVLAWHVDYWDRLGWKDPYGSEAFSKRQLRYARALKLKNRWTPMLMVDRKPVRGKQFPGAVEKAREVKAGYDATLSAVLKDGKVEARVKLRALDKKAKLGKNVVVQPVLYLRHVKTDCKAGENKGKTLEEYFVVVAAPTPPDRTAAFDKGVTVSIPAPKGVAAKDLGVAILLEDSVSIRSLGSWWSPVSAAKAKSK